VERPVTNRTERVIGEETLEHKKSSKKERSRLGFRTEKDILQSNREGEVA